MVCTLSVEFAMARVSGENFVIPMLNNGMYVQCRFCDDTAKSMACASSEDSTMATLNIDLLRPAKYQR